MMRRHIPAWLWLYFWLNTKHKSLLRHRIRQFWLLVTFFLFTKLKYPLRETRHESIGAIKRNPMKELKAIPAKAYKKCMEKWINRWNAYIGSKGVYFEGDDKDLY